MPRLRIMRGPNDIALELMPQDMRIAALHPAGHSLANKREGLMPIEPSQFDNLPVQLESMVGKLRFAKTYTPRDVIQTLVAAPESHIHGVQLGMCKIPQLD